MTVPRTLPSTSVAGALSHGWRSSTGTAGIRGRALWGRTWAVDRRSLGDTEGQQQTTNHEVSSYSQGSAWDTKPLERAFTRQRSQVQNLPRPPAQTLSPLPFSAPFARRFARKPQFVAQCYGKWRARSGLLRIRLGGGAVPSPHPGVPRRLALRVRAATAMKTTAWSGQTSCGDYAHRRPARVDPASLRRCAARLPAGPGLGRRTQECRGKLGHPGPAGR
jgi:hypothetical protein